MRILSILFCFVLPASLLAGHRSHIVNDDGSTRISIVRDHDGDSWASFEQNGVRYVTRDEDVLEQIEKALEKHAELSREHSRLGRRHSELGRQHSALGREHSRLGRMRGDEREIEEEQRKLEEKQRRLEDRQRELESEQRELEAKQRAAGREANRSIEKIFERAVREGKAKRN